MDALMGCERPVSNAGGDLFESGGDDLDAVKDRIFLMYEHILDRFDEMTRDEGEIKCDGREGGGGTFARVC